MLGEVAATGDLFAFGAELAVLGEGSPEHEIDIRQTVRKNTEFLVINPRSIFETRLDASVDTLAKIRGQRRICLVNDLEVFRLEQHLGLADRSQ